MPLRVSPKRNHAMDEMSSTPTSDSTRIVFLLGKRDVPADGIQDYCEYLGKALERRGIQTEIAHVDWDSQGWTNALRMLRARSAAWSKSWVVLQYTALSWSKHGFPLGVLAVLRSLKRRELHCAIVFHEPFGLSGHRMVERVRCACQNWAIRRLYGQADMSIFPVPLETIRWLSPGDPKAIFIPIGANIPECEGLERVIPNVNSVSRTIVIYCLSDLPHLDRELADIANAVRKSLLHGMKLRVVFLGRGTNEASGDINRAFDGMDAEVLNLGIQKSESVRLTLLQSDVMLCVRGPLYPRRGSALAGIACGVPIVGYAGAAEGTPIAEAGTELVPYGDREALGTALWRVLADRKVWQELHEKNLSVYRRYLSWDLIAKSMIDALGLDPA